MATYLEIAQTLARRMGWTIREYSDKKGIILILGKMMRKGMRNYVTFPQTPNPAEDVWVPGGHVEWDYSDRCKPHITALRPIFVAAGRPGATWDDLEAETDFAQMQERAKGLNETLGVDLLYVDVGHPHISYADQPLSLARRPILRASLRVFLGEPHWRDGWGGWVGSHKSSVWVEDGPDVLERLRALLDGFEDGTYPRADPYTLLQPDWTAQKEAALAIEQFVRSSAPRREPEREYLNYFGFDDTTD